MGNTFDESSPPQSGPPDPEKPGQPPGMDELSLLLSSIASPMRVAVLASLAHGPRRPDEIGRLLSLPPDETLETLTRLEQCHIVARDAQADTYALTPKVEVQEDGLEVRLLLRSDDGAQVTARLPLHTATGRLLARGLSHPEPDPPSATPPPAPPTP